LLLFIRKRLKLILRGGKGQSFFSNTHTHKTLLQHKEKQWWHSIIISSGILKHISLEINFSLDISVSLPDFNTFLSCRKTSSLKYQLKNYFIRVRRDIMTMIQREGSKGRQTYFVHDTLNSSQCSSSFAAVWTFLFLSSIFVLDNRSRSCFSQQSFRSISYHVAKLL